MSIFDQWKIEIAAEIEGAKSEIAAELEKQAAAERAYAIANREYLDVRAKVDALTKQIAKATHPPHRPRPAAITARLDDLRRAAENLRPPVVPHTRIDSLRYLLRDREQALRELDFIEPAEMPAAKVA
jgi:hypothetical protein